MSIKVALINMPFASPTSPSMGISLLKSKIEQAGHKCDNLYLNLHLLNHIYLDDYLAISEVATRVLLGEWIFANAAFGEIDDTGYFEEIQNKFSERLNYKITPERLLNIRNSIDPYLDECIDSYNWQQYDVIGFSTTYEQNVPSLALAKRIKEKWPEKQIIFGGANCEGSMGLALLEGFSYIDAICIGEGDSSFLTYLNNIDKKSSVDNITGIVTRRNINETKSPEQRTYVNLNVLPYPDFDDYFTKLKEIGLDGILKPYMLFESARGCWWGEKHQCTFCGLNGLNIEYRSKKEERILEEFIYLYEKYKDYTTRFTAVDNIMDYKYFSNFLPRLVDLHYDVEIFYETKANLSKAQLELMKKAGFTILQPGIESLLTEVLQQVNKGVNMLQNIRLLKWCKEFGLTPYWNIMYGFPQEDIDSYKKVADLILSLTHLKAPASCGPFRLSKFSPFFRDPDKYGIKNVRPIKLYQYVYPTLNDIELFNMAYYFEFDFSDQRNPKDYTIDMESSVNIWRQLDGKAEFYYSPTRDNALQLHDTRNGDLKTYNIADWQAILYTFCDDIRSSSQIQKHLSENGYAVDMSTVLRELKQMTENRLMISEDDKYLSLAFPKKSQD